MSHIRNAVKGNPPLNIVEYVCFQSLEDTILNGLRRIGAGTGIFTRALLAHPEWSSTIGQLKALEPSEGMRDQFSKTVKDDRVSVAEGSFDTTHVEDDWADLIVIAQVINNYHMGLVFTNADIQPSGIPLVPRL